jgi:predicted RNA-binding Zn-ribbon protein involved in translation (DUF1610 family)
VHELGVGMELHGRLIFATCSPPLPDMPSARRAEKIGVRYASLLSIARIDESRKGALLFCPDCGTLLDLPRGEEDSVTCEQCGHEEPADCM